MSGRAPLALQSLRRKVACARTSASASVIAPTASLGLFASFRAGDRWYFNLDAGGIGFSISNIGVGSWRALAETSYYFTDHWAGLAGWSIIGDKVDAESATGGWLNFKGSLSYGFQTIRLGLLYNLH